MKKVKILVASVLFCAMGYVSYTSYNQMIESRVERFMKSNVEALTLNEPGGSGGGAVVCRCTSEISTSTNGCYADGKSAAICNDENSSKCWEWHRNCKGSAL